ncbi:hypothetical protein HOY80DRAFT_997016 [Tuber brumale]|nr:hypothetical protein HOY80DRAFT_997016 [Tuber brumale]
MVSTAEFRTELNLTGRGGTVASRRYRDDAVSHPSLRGFQAKFNSSNKGPFANFHPTLDSLMLDVARLNSDDEVERSVAGPSGTQPEAVVHPPPTIYEEKLFKIIYIETKAVPQGTARLLSCIVPVGEMANRNSLGALKHYIPQELGEDIRKHLDVDEHLRKLVGISEDIQPLNATSYGTQPLTVACVLQCAPAPPPDGPRDAHLARPNTPLARRGDHYLEPGQFDVAEFYIEPASDPALADNLAHHTKRRKGFTRSNRGWRQIIQTKYRRVLRFQNHSPRFISRARLNQGPNYMSSYADLNGHVLPLPLRVPPPGCDTP